MLLHTDNYELLKAILIKVPAFAAQSHIDQETILHSALQSVATNNHPITTPQQLLQTNKMVIQLALSNIRALPKIDDYAKAPITREEAQTERTARMAELVEERQRQYDAAPLPISPIAKPAEVHPTGDMDVLYQERLAERSLSFIAPHTKIIEFGETDPPVEISKHVSWQVPTSIEEIRVELTEIRNEMKQLRTDLEKRILKDADELPTPAAPPVTEI